MLKGLRWACMNPMNFNKAKSKVLYLGWDKLKYKYRLGREWIEKSLGENDLEAFMNESLNMTHQCLHAAQRANHILDSIKRCDHQVKGDTSLSLI